MLFVDRSLAAGLAIHPCLSTLWSLQLQASKQEMQAYSQRAPVDINTVTGTGWAGSQVGLEAYLKSEVERVLG